MGLPMARNLIQKKTESASSPPENEKGENASISISSLVAFDTNATARQTLMDHQQLKEEGADGSTTTTVEVVKSVGDVGAAECDAIITMLPGCKTVDAVMQELHEGLAAAAASSSSTTFKDISFIDCSTVSPTTSARWQTFWESEGHSMHDAPVSGGVMGATAGTLTFMVGSPYVRADFQSSIVRPLLERMGRRIVLCGGPGTGAITKLCNNLAMAAEMAGICEALNLGEALGVDPVVLASVMNTSTAACWSSQVNNPHPAVAAAMARDAAGNQQQGPPASRDYQGGFASKLMLKDLGLAVAAAEEASVAVPVAAVSKELYRLASLRGFGEQDFGVLLEFLKGK